MVLLAGIDLAWNSSRNPSAIAVGMLHGTVVTLTALGTQLFGAEAIVSYLDEIPQLQGVAIDGPLIIHNVTGQRTCERDLGRDYAARFAACHPTNLTLYPDADGVRIALALEQRGFLHLGASDNRWQVECYPHPALIEIFDLPQRLRYKKGRVVERRQGQTVLAQRLLSLQDLGCIRLHIDPALRIFFRPDYIASLTGRQLKHNEDVLDAVICLYIAALYQAGLPQRVYGDTETGYIVVPKGGISADSNKNPPK